MIKSILFFTIISFLIYGCNANKKLKETRSVLKQYAYCRCVEFASGDSSFFRSDVSVGIYADISQHSRSSLQNVDDLAKYFASTIKPSIIADHGNKKAILFNCFEFYESKRLDSLIKTLDREFIYTKGW